MRLLLCIDSGRANRLVSQVAALVTQSASWIPLHVIDSRPRVDLGILRAGVPGGGALPESQRSAIEAAGRERALLVLDAAVAALNAPGAVVDAPLVRVGEPGHTICAAASEVSADLIALFASRHIDKPQRGPGSIGHTARFVIDHAPCPVLVIRGVGVPDSAQ
jgi:nucleotide-binding universal stress UspA family protein